MAGYNKEQIERALKSLDYVMRRCLTYMESPNASMEGLKESVITYRLARRTYSDTLAIRAELDKREIDTSLPIADQ